LIFQTFYLKIDVLFLFISLFWILRSLFSIILGIIYRNKEKGIRFSYLLTIVGLIGILWAFLYTRIAVIIYDAFDFDFDLLNLLLYAFGLVGLFLNVVSYGIVFTFIRIKTSRSSGYFLKLSGISLIIGGVLVIISLAIINAPNAFDLPPHEKMVKIFMEIIYYLGACFIILATSLFLAYSIRLVDINLGVIALLFMFEWILTFILYSYLFSIDFL